MKYICTYFDRNYLSRGLALISSLEKHASKFKIYILTLDRYTFDYIINLKNEKVVPISLDDYGEYFSLDNSKFKTKKEFYFSLTPGFCLYLIEQFNQIDLLIYLDADVYLFNNIDFLYSEIGSASIAICPQRLPIWKKVFFKNYGIFNVGVNGFRSDPIGIKCLKDWFDDCSKWDQNITGYKLRFFSDQIWLDT